MDWRTGTGVIVACSVLTIGTSRESTLDESTVKDTLDFFLLKEPGVAPLPSGGWIVGPKSCVWSLSTVRLAGRLLATEGEGGDDFQGLLTAGDGVSAGRSMAEDDGDLPGLPSVTEGGFDEESSEGVIRLTKSP